MTATSFGKPDQCLSNGRYPLLSFKISLPMNGRLLAHRSGSWTGHMTHQAALPWLARRSNRPWCSVAVVGGLGR